MSKKDNKLKYGQGDNQIQEKLKLLSKQFAQIDEKENLNFEQLIKQLKNEIEKCTF